MREYFSQPDAAPLSYPQICYRWKCKRTSAYHAITVLAEEGVLETVHLVRKLQLE